MTKLFPRIFVAIAFLLITASTSFSQSPDKTILVLDGSGSMWGQIDGEAKITIAQRVIGELLSTLPEGQQLGLTAYGHREKGNCQDIETLVTPGPDTRQAIMDAVNAISPKGKTPLSAAVIAAAEQLQYEESKATVILVSDGIETCNLDPCAVGAQLEQTGVDFTTHVVGFDVSDPIALAQLQCLAENTGGRFMTASNASELSQALIEVSIQEETAPAILEIGLDARDGIYGPIIDAGLVWTLTNQDTGEVVLENVPTAQILQELEEGTYLAEARRTSDGAMAKLVFSAAAGGSRAFTLTMPFTAPDATIKAVETAVIGSTISVQWTGPAEANDYISVAEIGSKDTIHVNFTYTQEGNTLELLMPPTPGTYELRYVMYDRRVSLVFTPITVTEIGTEFSAPETAIAGDTLVIPWTGPDYKNDYISIAEIGSAGNKYLEYTYTRKGSPLQLQMPGAPGTYEIRYVQKQDAVVLVHQIITVDAATASLGAPNSGATGSTISVEWDGPAYSGDYISIAIIGAKDKERETFKYVKNGNPLILTLPEETGEYELRYVMKQDATVLARIPIQVTE